MPIPKKVSLFSTLQRRARGGDILLPDHLVIILRPYRVCRGTCPEKWPQQFGGSWRRYEEEVEMMGIDNLISFTLVPYLPHDADILFVNHVRPCPSSTQSRSRSQCDALANLPAPCSTPSSRMRPSRKTTSLQSPVSSLIKAHKISAQAVIATIIHSDDLIIGEDASTPLPLLSSI